MVHLSLFCSHFSSRKLVCNKNYRGVGYAVDRFINAIDRRLSCSPLLNRDCGSLFEVRSARQKVRQERIWLRSLKATRTDDVAWCFQRAMTFISVLTSSSFQFYYPCTPDASRWKFSRVFRKRSHNFSLLLRNFSVLSRNGPWFINNNNFSGIQRIIR